MKYHFYIISRSEKLVFYIYWYHKNNLYVILKVLEDDFYKS
jgi:hypothetical protein